MSKPFFAARMESWINQRLARCALQRGWSDLVVGYTGYGSPTFVRVMARVLLVSETSAGHHPLSSTTLLDRRGWRNFFAPTHPYATVEVQIDGQSFEVVTDRSGYIDTRLPVSGLAPGWHTALLRCGDTDPTPTPIKIIAGDEDWGLVSDIDDTVITTFLPRPLLAAWNTFVLQESARQAVPGMSELYADLMADHPDAPVIYLSTGAWNTAPTLNRFLNHHHFPRGPLLLTDWGPTNSGWFRSGPEHKKTSLRDLALDFPNIKWILIGDDGQHDPALYGEFAEAHPDRVRVIGLRQLSATESVLAHGTTQTLAEIEAVETAVPVVRAPNGYRLLPKLRAALGRR